MSILGVRNLNLYLILVLTTVLVVTYVTNTTHDVKERKKEVNIEINSVHSPMLIAYWVIIILFAIIHESIQYRIYSIPV